MEITKIASGSDGNCYRLEEGGRLLMIECGIPIGKIEKAFNYQLSRACGCLLSHEHRDHSASASQIASRAVTTYSTRGTIENIVNIYRYKHRFISLEKNVFTPIGSGIKIYPFSTIHDANDPVGFLIDFPESRVLYAVDTGRIDYVFPGVTHMIVECNHRELDVIDNPEIGMYAKERILRNHFSISRLTEYLQLPCVIDSVKEIYLAHISKRNGNAEEFRAEIAALTGREVFI